jgi:membrane protease subunit HflK
MFGGGGGSGSGSAGKKGFRLSPQLIGIVVLILVAVWFAFGWYQVDEQERGVVLRLGKVQELFTEPGLRWNPKFIDEVIKVNMTRINSSEHSQQMLTEDDNIVKVDLVVQFRVSEPIKYVVDIREPEESLKHAAESALRHVVGGSTMEAVITTGREVLGDDVKDRLQNYLNRYETGIEVVGVNIEAVEPPQEVQAAFDDVQKAKEDQVKFMNEANALAEQIVPEARGEAQRIIENASAYRDQVIALAQGEADRFTKLLTEYQLAKEVTKDRLYITAIETVLKSTSIVMVDVSGGNNLLLLPLDEMLRRGTASAGMTGDDVSATNNPSTTFPGNLRSNSRSGQ